MAPFPLAKLAYLAIRQVSKPLANRIKARAKTHKTFRTWICMPPAQFYHWADVVFRMRLMNMRKPTAIKRLTEEEAVELGADMLGEGIIFLVASVIVYAEVARSSRKEQAKEDMQNDRLAQLDTRNKDLGLRVERQSVQIRELTRCLAALSPRRVDIPDSEDFEPTKVTAQIQERNRIKRSSPPDSSSGDASEEVEPSAGGQTFSFSRLRRWLSFSSAADYPLGEAAETALQDLGSSDRRHSTP